MLKNPLSATSATRAEPPPIPAPRPGARWPIGVLRAVSVLVLIQVLLQAALAGGFVTGQVSLLGLHSANGTLLFLTSGLLVVGAVLLVRPGRGPWWPIVVATSVWLLITFQAGIGFARLIGLHIPIGVALMGLISGFTWWACAYRTRR
ncbi:hypothetical protein [Actinoplanes sp. NBRC 103695]|uniref:hypothetical protein n=1 Tax=Actinoplanes sp. NBRC 103695 TaxID=3032202 RepID=UPI0024A48D63|nr:hypothetical protein [Actinoplanes sp. NBRC 103695]GLY94271.1 hypothetical protein Acsp02_15270 [Actinoplanes sp. NBRC 103695]